MGFQNLSRRHVLTVLPATTALAGCSFGVTTPDADPARTLRILKIRAWSTEGGWWVELEVDANFVGRYRDNEEYVFQDVHVIGRTRSREVICQAIVGDMGPNREQQTVTMQCDQFPHIIQPASANVPPCGDYTTLQGVSYTADKSPTEIYNRTPKADKNEIIWNSPDYCHLDVPPPPTPGA